MSNIVALTFVWNGEAMEPLDPRTANRQYAVGETYRLIPHEERSKTSHNHYFACVVEAWKNLSEHDAERYPTSEHLRKWALVRAGYRNERAFACDTARQAMQIAAAVKAVDEYAVVVVRGSVVMVYTAKSQSSQAMGKAVFQKSKDDVLGILSQLIGTDVVTLSSNVKNNPT